MTIEQEVLIIAKNFQGTKMDSYAIALLQEQFGKALKAKQDRIEDLEKKLEKKLELEKEERNRWQDSACRLEGNLDTAVSTIDELEGALKYYANMKALCQHDDPSWCEYCPYCGNSRPKEKRKLWETINSTAQISSAHPTGEVYWHQLAEGALNRVCEEIDSVSGVLINTTDANNLKQHLKDELL